MIKCKDWMAAISKYKAKQYKNRCRTCLYQQDTVCPAGTLQKEKKRYEAEEKAWDTFCEARKKNTPEWQQYTHAIQALVEISEMKYKISGGETEEAEIARKALEDINSRMEGKP